MDVLVNGANKEETVSEEHPNKGKGVPLGGPNNRKPTRNAGFEGRIVKKKKTACMKKEIGSGEGKDQPR